MVSDDDTANVLGDKGLGRGRIGGTRGESADRVSHKGGRVDVQTAGDKLGGVISLESVNVGSESTDRPS